MQAKRILLIFSAFAMVVLSGAIGQGQTSVDISNRIRATIEAKDWKGARAEVEKLSSSDPSLFRSRNYDYLLARIAEETTDFTTATKNYQTSVSSNSPLAEYALWHLARIARATGDLALEREHLRKLTSLAPGSLLYDAASLRLAKSFFESDDYAAAITTARTLSSAKTASIAREALLLTGQAYLGSGKYSEARDVFIRLVMQMPDASRPDDFALAAARELDQLANRTDLATVPLTEADHLLRASVYQFNRDFAGARVHYQAIVNSNPQSGAVPNATYQLGRGLYLESKYDEAVKAFQSVVDQFPQSQSARDALSSLAASYLRLKRIDDAIAAYKLFIDRFPDAPNPERPYLNIIDVLHESGRYPEALNWIQQARTRFKGDLGGALALFAQLRIHLAQNAWADVIRDADELLKLSDLGGTRVGGGTTSSEVSFLKAFSLERLGRTDDAVSAYLAIPDGRNEYYGNRATQHLLSMTADEKTRGAITNRLNVLMSSAKAADAQGQPDQARIAAQSAMRLSEDKTKRGELIAILRRSYAMLPNYKLPELHTVALTKSNSQTDPSSTADSNHQRLGDLLFDLALYDEAMPEIFAARGSPAKPAATATPASVASDEAYTLALYSLRGGLPNRGVRFGEQLWKAVPADYVLEVAPRELVEPLYPAPFRESLLKHAASRNVDPRFVLSIVRQESRYQVDVKSVSAARGMMQFIASTANEIAAQLKLKDFSQDDLYYPDTAVLFGSQYLANLFQQFPNQPQAVAGSYNGGADNLTRWIARARASEADRYVPEIGFSQTKDYVYKVMANYWNYQRLYDAQLQPITQ
jgi:soluble lytic murein transglycosylase-like protein/tetratricopeptide (TPR) repeat protein